MEKIKIIVVFLLVALFSSCAGMPAQYNQNMATNSTIWGGIGAIGAAAIASVTGHDVGKAMVEGGIIGALVGAANTPLPQTVYQGEASSSAVTMSERERLAYERGRAEGIRQRREQQRRAYEGGYYGY